MTKATSTEWISSRDRVVLGLKMMSPRFSSWDRQRSLSMADEGGVSAAWMEGEELGEHREPISGGLPTFEKDFWNSLLDTFDKNRIWIVSSSLVSAGIGYYFVRNRLNRVAI